MSEGIVLRFCKCGAVLTTRDIQEGVPCKRCRDKKKMVLKPLFKQARKPNPAPDIWSEKHAEAK